MKILIVDDDPISRRLLRKIVSKFGHCDTASDGLEAIDSFLQSIREKNIYDLILLDINMPESDGQETLKAIRGLEYDNNIMTYEQTTIIMVTVNEDAENIMSAFKTGCEGYIVKPFEPEQIERKIKEVFNKGL